MKPTAYERADRPAVTIAPSATVREATLLLVEAHVGALVVVEYGCAVGIFSELDVLTKVVLGKLDTETTTVASVMTTPVVTIGSEAPLSEARKLMREHGVRHLPVAEWDGHTVGMLSVRHLEHDELDYLQDSVNTLEAYASYDGASG